MFVLCQQMGDLYLGRATAKTTRFNNVFQETFGPRSIASVTSPHPRCLWATEIQVTLSGRSERGEANKSRCSPLRPAKGYRNRCCSLGFPSVRRVLHILNKLRRENLQRTLHGETPVARPWYRRPQIRAAWTTWEQNAGYEAFPECEFHWPSELRAPAFPPLTSSICPYQSCTNHLRFGQNHAPDRLSHIGASRRDGRLKIGNLEVRKLPDASLQSRSLAPSKTRIYRVLSRAMLQRCAASDRNNPAMHLLPRGRHHSQGRGSKSFIHDDGLLPSRNAKQLHSVTASIFPGAVQANGELVPKIRYNASISPCQVSMCRHPSVQYLSMAWLHGRLMRDARGRGQLRLSRVRDREAGQGSKRRRGRP